MPGTTYTTLKEAILNKHQVMAIYDGCFRALCPHAVGTKNGEERVLAYQWDGESNQEGRIVPDSGNNWRCLTVSRLEDVTSEPGKWYTHESYEGPGPCMDWVDVQI